MWHARVPSAEHTRLAKWRTLIGASKKRTHLIKQHSIDKQVHLRLFDHIVDLQNPHQLKQV
jgi:hypothetical protein